jgi:F-type H+-transporting ATPase subunit delta
MSSKNVKISQPYAEAFLELFNAKSLDTVINDLNFISSILTGSAELKTLLSNPLINPQTKKSVIKSIFNEKIDIKALRFLLVLCDRGRIAYLPSILDKSLELAYKAASIETVQVSTSIAFNSSQQEALISKLKRMTGAEQIKLEITTKPNLIGGFIVQVGSKIIDTSIQGQLRDLSSYLGASSI